MDEVKKLRNFDNKRKTYKDRKEHVEKVLNDVDVSEALRGCLSGFDDNGYNYIEYSLDELGTYLLKSHDVESERKIENSFYQREKDYYKSAINKNSVHTDFYNENQQFTLDENVEEPYIEYLYKLFSEADTTSKRNIIKAISSDEFNELDDCALKDFITTYFEDYINESRDGKDLLVLNFLARGMTDKETSAKLKISRPAVSKRIKKVIN